MSILTNRSCSVDILYSNVKHAFFQPAKNDVVVLLHFNLKHPVLLGKKKIEVGSRDTGRLIAVLIALLMSTYPRTCNSLLR